MSKLFIIGNGFDIHHGVRSRYTDFADWVKTVDYDVHSAVETFLPAWVDAEGKVQNAWSDLEHNLENSTPTNYSTTDRIFCQVTVPTTGVTQVTTISNTNLIE